MKSERMIETDIKLLLYDIQTYCKKWKDVSKLARTTYHDVSDYLDNINGVKTNVVAIEK